MNRLVLPLAAAALAVTAVSAPAQAPGQSAACRNETDRFAATFATPQRTAPGDGTMAGSETAPGARAGVSLSDEDRRQLRRRIDEARAAADRGDAESCVRALREARASLRQSGFGGSAGSASAGGRGSLSPGTAGSTPGAGGSGGGSGNR
ncbi:MAG TPA: hypothetical protein VD978_35235 [Azospirillum sp.]|nr:hypothetical protein [Azospirillum sp.]